MAVSVPQTSLKKAAAVGAAVAMIPLLVYVLLRFTPFPELRDFQNRPYSTRVRDRSGQLLQILPLEDGVRREFVPLADMPPEVPLIFIASEDSRFYLHHGIDFEAVFRAARQNAFHGRIISGASTITMQLARLVVPSQAPPFWAKIKEALNALRLEARLGKDAILELYLNSIPFGFQTEGVASAARTFFAADLSALHITQVFCLSVIPRRPVTYNPLYEPENCAAAARQVYKRSKNLTELFQIADSDWEAAARTAQKQVYPALAPHFIRYLTPQLRDAKNVSLSIDLDTQRYVENLLASAVDRYRDQRLTNGAALVIRNETGEILAWVGSADFFNQTDSGQVDGVLALNQPGSAIKPFLYALALDSGFEPAHVFADVPMNFGSEQLYIPGNFNNRFNGPVRMRTALASSLNIPAVYLLYRLGVQNYADKLVELGFDSVGRERDSAGLGMALGNAPVALAEAVRAFSVFPRDGSLIPLVWEKTPPATAVQAEGAAAPAEHRQVYDPDTARIICSFLSDKAERSLAFGQGKSFELPFPAIFKTGTANQFQSIEAYGATPLYTVGVWMGNFTGETVIGKTGSSVPAEIARDTLKYLQGTTSLPFAEPDSYRKAAVCALSGLEPTAACGETAREYVKTDENLPKCFWHYLENGKPSVRYPAEYQSWFLSASRAGGLDHSTAPLTIVTPRDRFVFLSAAETAQNGGIPVEVTGGAADTLQAACGGITMTVNRPFRFFLPAAAGSHTLNVRCGNEIRSVQFTVE